MLLFVPPWSQLSRSYTQIKLIENLLENRFRVPFMLSTIVWLTIIQTFSPKLVTISHVCTCTGVCINYSRLFNPCNLWCIFCFTRILQFSFLQGGGWCNNVTTCFARKSNRLGSSDKMAKQVEFSGLLSNKQKFNPGKTSTICHLGLCSHIWC